MSNYLAIATVTATLNQLISSGISQNLSGVHVTNQPLDVAVANSSRDALNIYLYHVSSNPGRRNLDQSVRNSNGDIVKKPQLALDLHYIITAIAAKNDDIRAHEILACAMRTLHESPVLTRQMVRQAILAVSSLASSDLADQIELVKVVPQSLTIEEITKLWSSFFQINYRISAAYQATVVLLDSIYDSKPTLPVRTPQLAVLPFNQPTILQVLPQILPYAPGATTTKSVANVGASSFSVNNTAGFVVGQNVTIGPGTDFPEVFPVSSVGGSSIGISPKVLAHPHPVGSDVIGAPLVITGRNLMGGSDLEVSVKVGEVLPTSTLAELTSTQIVMALPPGLTPGVKAVQVIQDLELPSPGGPTPHHGFESNVVPFVLAPTFTSPPPSSVAVGSTLAVNFQPAVASQQRVSFLLGDYEIPLDQRPPSNPPVNTLSATIPNTLQSGMSTIPFPTGTYLFRLRVDGADSPTTGPYTQPMVTVTP